MGTKHNQSKHGLTGQPIYQLYREIKFRCTNKNNYHAKWYVDRGIIMCDEWLNDPKTFCDWALSNGYKKGLSIDRIDNNKGYSPDNCRFVNHKTQCNNKSCNHKITIDGITKTLTQWAEYSGVGRKTIERNLKKGYTGKDILKPEAFKKTFSKIAQYDFEGNLIKIWDSPTQIKKGLNLKSISAISAVCKKKPYYNQAFGFGWAYYPEDKWELSRAIKKVRGKGVFITVNKETHTYEEWSKLLNISIDYFRHSYYKLRNDPKKLKKFIEQRYKKED